MVTITLKGITANTALELVAELKDCGLILNKDFEWVFHRENIMYDLGGHEITPKFCEFKFYDPKLATFYALRWQNYFIN